VLGATVVGEPVGEPVGATLGDAVGAALGATVDGAAVGAAVGVAVVTVEPMLGRVQGVVRQCTCTRRNVSALWVHTVDSTGAPRRAGAEEQSGWQLRAAGRTELRAQAAGRSRLAPVGFGLFPVGATEYLHERGADAVGARLGFGWGALGGFATRGIGTGVVHGTTHRTNTNHQSEADVEDTYCSNLKVRAPR
jgi:hypothetical protein